MNEALKKANLNENFPSKLDQERVAFFDTKENIFMSIFYHIRNSLAHGSFEIVSKGDNNIFVLENIYYKDIRARMILKTDTLLNWIKIIEGGPQ